MLHLRPSLALRHKWKIRGTYCSHEERGIFLSLKREIMFYGGISIFTQYRSFRDLKLHFTVAPAANPPKQTPLFCPEPNPTLTKRLCGRGWGDTWSGADFYLQIQKFSVHCRTVLPFFSGREESHIPSRKLVFSQAQHLLPHQKQFPRSHRQVWTGA